MNTSVLKGSALSATIVLATVGMGLRPARADWVKSPNSQDYVPLNVFVGKAFVSFTEQGAGSAPQTPDPTPVSGSATQKFLWQGIQAPPSQVTVNHGMTITGKVSTNLSATGPCYVIAKVLVHSSSSSTSPDPIFEASKSYNYYSNQVDVIKPNNNPVYASIKSSFQVQQGPNGTLQSFVVANFDVTLSDHAVWGSNYSWDSVNNRPILYGHGDATADLISARTADIYVVQTPAP